MYEFLRYRLHEPLLQILHNLRRFLKPGARTLPAGMENFIELVDAQDSLYGLAFSIDTRYRPLNDVGLTTKAKYLSIDFLQDRSFVDITVRCTIADTR